MSDSSSDPELDVNDQPSPKKSVLSESMEQSHAVRAYLSAWDTKSARSRQSPDELRAAVSRIETKMVGVSSIRKLQLMQKRREIQTRIETFESAPDITDIESRFVVIVDAYSQQQGIDYETWREYGIPASVLKAGGMRPQSRKTR